MGDLSFELSAGEILGVTGVNGSGKTTLLKVLAGEVSPDTGRVAFIDDKSTSRRTGDFSGDVALMSQRLYRWSGPLYRYLSYVAATHGCLRDRNVDTVEYHLHRMGLSRFRAYSWRKLSGGHRVRAALAALLIAKPRVLLLDEPLAHLDPAAQRSFLSDLKGLCSMKARGLVVVVSSQHVREIEGVCDKVLCLGAHGEVVYQGRAKGRISRGTSSQVFFVALKEGAGSVRYALGEIRAQRILEWSDREFIVATPGDSPASDIVAAIESYGMRIVEVRDITCSAERVMYGV
jgi:ABC-2 type transport system ATP-binding protein